MTMMTDAEYVAVKGNRCPHCGSDDLDSGAKNSDNGEVYIDVSCNSCDREWVEVYKLIGWTSG